eukprot:TRINITY_DN19862_c0_g1_i1.p1 TRINITY_DN19862_c0_g1~~TRINITY_DN19862_c0_g1_i1.p1  ORF type:complete len:867 (-),score=49.36 TRINITY_DN19862_c0_g1_i1:236-2836(-)
MYGWIQQSIEQLVLDKFGLDVWNQIKAEAGCGRVPLDGFVRHESYDDDLTLKLVAAASKVLNIDAGDVLQVYGGYFVEWLCDQGYKGYLRSQGRDLFEFLYHMNRMHQNLKLSMPHLVPPEMTVEPDSEANMGDNDWDVLWLTYTSQRGGLATMMLGIVPACAKLVYGQTVSCTLEKQWTGNRQGDEQLLGDPMAPVETNLYRVAKQQQAAAPATVAGQGAGHMRSPTQDQMGALAMGTDSYNFFQDNPVMAPGWVECIIKDVIALDAHTAKAFAAAFDIRMLTSLLMVSTPHALRALHCLFRAPIRNDDVSTPCPTLSYVCSRGVEPYASSRTYPDVSMTEDVAFGSNALVQLKPDRRLGCLPRLLAAFRGPRAMTQVVVSVCMVPNLHTNSHLLRALYDTPNDDVLKEPIVSALIAAAAGTVWPRVVLDTTLSILNILLISLWVVSPSCRFVGWPFLAILLFKHVIAGAMATVAYAKRGWLQKCVSWWIGISLARDIIHINMLYAVLYGDVSERYKRYSLGFYACMAWWCLLRDMCVTEFLGPKVLPIVSALASLGPFMVFIAMICAGFVYLLAALDGLDDPEIGIYLAALQAAMLPEISGDPNLPRWVEVWLYITAAVLGVVLLNILIGVLSEAYDVARDDSAILYNRARALSTLNTRLSMLGRTAKACDSVGPAVAFVRDMLTAGCHERCGGDSLFLWVVAEKFSRAEAMRRTRLGTLKQHVTNTCLQAQDDITTDLTRVIDSKIPDISRCPAFSSKARVSLQPRSSLHPSSSLMGRTSTKDFRCGETDRAPKVQRLSSIEISPNDTFSTECTWDDEKPCIPSCLPQCEPGHGLAVCGVDLRVGSPRLFKHSSDILDPNNMN